MSRASTMIIDESGAELREGYHDYHATYCAPLPHYPLDPAQIAQLERDADSARADASYTAFCNGQEMTGL